MPELFTNSKSDWPVASNNWERVLLVVVAVVRRFLGAGVVSCAAPGMFSKTHTKTSKDGDATVARTRI